MVKQYSVSEFLRIHPEAELPESVRLELLSDAQYLVRVMYSDSGQMLFSEFGYASDSWTLPLS